MVLHVDSDAAYLVAPKAHSCVARYFHLSDHPNITKHPKMNGAILVECTTLRHVVSSSTEAEVAGIYHNARIAVPIRHIIKYLDHPQPPTPLKTDNSTVTGFAYNNIHKKRSNPGTCATIGYAIDKHNNSSKLSGNMAQITIVIILQSITPRFTLRATTQISEG